MVKLLLLCILAICGSADFFWGGCPKYNPVSNFDTQRYLGQWYEIARTNVPYRTTGKCNRAHYAMMDNGNIDVTNKCLEETGYRTVKGEATCTPGVGKCWVAFSKYAPWADYSVLDVNYDTHSVILSCTSFWFFHFEYAWILGRTMDFDYEKVVGGLES